MLNVDEHITITYAEDFGLFETFDRNLEFKDDLFVNFH